MSKQQLQAQLTKEQAIAELLLKNPEQAPYFQYIANKYPDATSDQLLIVAAEKNNTDEYFFKISYLNQIHHVDLTTAGKILNAPVIIKEGMKNALFTTEMPFMHYIAVNAIPANIVESYVNQWVTAGLSLNMQDKKGQTPLDYALVKSRIDCVKEFSKGGLDLTELTNGFSPLHKLVQQVQDGESQPEVIKTWCDLKLPTGTVSAKGWTPLEFAVGQGNVGAVLKFVEGGIGISHDSLDKNTTVLHYCVAYDKVDIIKALIGKCDFNVKDFSSSPAIAQALVNGKEAIVKALVAGGTDLKTADQASGQTILHLLLKVGLLPQAALAAQVGYDVNLKDLAGSSPMDLLINGISKGLYADPSLSFDAVKAFCEKGIVEAKHLEAITMSNIANKAVILGELKSHFVEKVEVPVIKAPVVEAPAAPAVVESIEDMIQRLKTDLGMDTPHHEDQSVVGDIIDS